MTIPKRANTREEKEQVLAAILLIWESLPGHRLGQLIENAALSRPAQLFCVEDWDLVTALTHYQIRVTTPSGGDAE